MGRTLAIYACNAIAGLALGIALLVAVALMLGLFSHVIVAQGLEQQFAPLDPDNARVAESTRRIEAQRAHFRALGEQNYNASLNAMTERQALHEKRRDALRPFQPSWKPQ